MSADFDKAIDDAVREMLAVEPPADLRERVVGRLPASGSRRPDAGFQLPAAGFRLPAPGWVLGSIGAAAIIVLAVFVAPRSEPVPPQASLVARAVDRHVRSEAQGVPAAPAISSSAPSPRPIPSVATSRRPTRGDGVVQAMDAPDADASAALAPLPSITPISVMPIVESRIAPADIAVRTLTPISEMQIAPLTPPDRR